MNIPHTTPGAPLLACELDETCASLDCDALMEDYADALLSSPEGEEFVAHYCGPRYLHQDETAD